jgi:hypothetical protein
MFHFFMNHLRGLLLLKSQDNKNRLYELSLGELFKTVTPLDFRLDFLSCQLRSLGALGVLVNHIIESKELC